MENSNSNASSPTNGIVGNANIFADKPDELASTGNIQPQLQSLLQLHPNLLPNLQLSQQQKKCLHRRLLMQTQTMLPATTAFPTQRPYPIQQQPPMQLQLQQQPLPSQQQQRLPSRISPTPTTLSASGNATNVINASAGATIAASAAAPMISAVSTINNVNTNSNSNNNHNNNVNMINTINNGGNAAASGISVVGINNANNNYNASSNSVPIIHNQNGLVQQLNAALLAERYLLMDLVEGSTLYKCIDVKSHEELVCKVANNPCSNLLSAHFRLDGHAHVNPLHKVIQGSSQTYLFFTPSEGDLHSYVRVRKRLREPEAKRLFRQMCEVVKSCHEQGIVLRDLKLRKFVFADAERTHLRLESLEDAVVLDDPNEDLLQDKRGCPAYVSPEILKANTMYSGKAADMWSLGVILYTMLVGRYPFNDSEHASLFAKISRGQFLVPECLTSKARCMIRSLLRKEPEERILSEDILLHPWMTVDENRDFTKSTTDQMVPDIFLDGDDA